MSLLLLFNAAAVAPAPPAPPSVELLGGGPGKRKQYDKDSYMARLLAPPIEDAPVEIETGIVEVVPDSPTIRLAKPRRDDSAEIRASYREAAKEIAEKKRRQRQEEDDEAIAIFAALL